jgi:hypothetical protein
VGVPSIIWDVDTGDWQHRDPKKIVKAVKAQAGPGSVVLMHSIHPSTAKAAPAVYATVADKGLYAVTVRELFAGIPWEKAGSYFCRGYADPLCSNPEHPFGAEELTVELLRSNPPPAFVPANRKGVLILQVASESNGAAADRSRRSTWAWNRSIGDFSSRTVASVPVLSAAVAGSLSVGGGSLERIPPFGFADRSILFDEGLTDDATGVVLTRIELLPIYVFEVVPEVTTDAVLRSLGHPPHLADEVTQLLCVFGQALGSDHDQGHNDQDHHFGAVDTHEHVTQSTVDGCSIDSWSAQVRRAPSAGSVDG